MSNRDAESPVRQEACWLLVHKRPSTGSTAVFAASSPAAGLLTGALRSPPRPMDPRRPLSWHLLLLLSLAFGPSCGTGECPRGGAPRLPAVAGTCTPQVGRSRQGWGLWLATSSSGAGSGFRRPLSERKEHCEFLGCWVPRGRATNPCFQGNQGLGAKGAHKSPSRPGSPGREARLGLRPEAAFVRSPPGHGPGCRTERGGGWGGAAPGEEDCYAPALRGEPHAHSAVGPGRRKGCGGRRGRPRAAPVSAGARAVAALRSCRALHPRSRAAGAGEARTSGAWGW